MGRITTPLCRIAFPHIFAPKVQTNTDNNTGETYTTKKYQAALLFDESVAEELKALKQEAIKEGIAEFGEHFEKLVEQRSVKWPFRDGGDINANTGQPYYGEGITFVNVSSHDKPGVVSRYAAPGEKKPAIVTDPAELWPGEYVKANVTIKPFNRKDSKGVAVYINGLQLWHEGDRLDNRVAVEDSFEAEGERPAASYEQPPAHGDSESSLL